MTEKEQQFNQWFDEYANGVKVFEEADMKQAYLQGRAELEKENADLQKSHQDLYNSMRVIKDQRNKAKEIIQELLSSCFGYNSKTVNYEVKAKAEQFLDSEVGK